MKTEELEEKIAELIIAAKKDVDYFNDRGEFDPNPYWLAESIAQIFVIGDVSGSFTWQNVEQSWNDGINAEKNRCGEFDIENYR